MFTHTSSAMLSPSGLLSTFRKSQQSFRLRRISQDLALGLVDRTHPGSATAHRPGPAAGVFFDSNISSFLGFSIRVWLP
jgi:hypothetical protein